MSDTREPETRDTLAKHYRRLTGIEAAARLLAEAKQEEFVSLWLLARALGISTRRLRRDWKERGQHVTRVGFEDRIVARQAIAAYFPHVREQTNPPSPPA